MLTRDLPPTDIGKYPELTEAAQSELGSMDVLVCGKCSNVFHFVEEFRMHKLKPCQREKESSLRDCNDTKPKIWAFLLWKSAQLKQCKILDNNKGNIPNSWSLYQNWVKLDESVRDTWLVAGKTIQAFTRVAQGGLTEMPVKITKTVVNNNNNFNNNNNNNNNDTRKTVTNQARSQSQQGTKTTSPLSVKTSTGGGGGQQTAGVATAVVAASVTLTKDDAEILKNGGGGGATTTTTGASTGNVVKRSLLLQKQQTNATTLGLAAQNSGTGSSSTGAYVRRTPLPNETESDIIEELIEKVVAKRFNPRRKTHEYLVKWEGRPHEGNTWEPQVHLDAAPEIVEIFEKQLAKQKENRALQQTRVDGGQTTTTGGGANTAATGNKLQPNNSNTTQSERPIRTSKTKAMDQVKQWMSGTVGRGGSGLIISSGGGSIGSDSASPTQSIDVGGPSSNGGGAGVGGGGENEWPSSGRSLQTLKRKFDDSSDERTTSINLSGMSTFEDLEEDLIPSHTVKRAVIEVNGNVTSSATIAKVSDPNKPAEVVITNDKNSGVVKRSDIKGTLFMKKPRPEGAIRMLSKAESAITNSGVIRANNNNTNETTTIVGAGSGATITTSSGLTISSVPITAANNIGEKTTTAPTTADGKIIISGTSRLGIPTHTRQSLMQQRQAAGGQTSQQQQQQQKTIIRTPAGTTIQRKTISNASNVSTTTSTGGGVGGGVTATRGGTHHAHQQQHNQTSAQSSSGRMIIPRTQSNTRAAVASSGGGGGGISGSNVVNTTQITTHKNVTPEEKIIQLSKSGDLKVTRKVMTREDAQAQRKQQLLRQQQQQQQIQIQKVQHHVATSSPAASSSSSSVVASNKTNLRGGGGHAATTTTILGASASAAATSTSSDDNDMKLCPYTGKLLNANEQQQNAAAASIHEQEIQVCDDNDQQQQQQQQQQQEQQQQIQDFDPSMLLSGDHILTNEDGTPLLVTGEDGTVYQVAGKNAEGQTILVTQGPDGEQQFAYVAAADGSDGDAAALALDTAVAEAVAQLPPEQAALLEAAAAASDAAASEETTSPGSVDSNSNGGGAGGNNNGGNQYLVKTTKEDGTTQVVTMTEAELQQHQALLDQQAQEDSNDNTGQICIQTGDDNEANIPAEVVQADLPSPGGTRRVVLLLQDGTFMMTEMHDDEYKQLNLQS